MKRYRLRAKGAVTVALATLALTSQPLFAEIADVAPGGFTVRLELEIAADRDAVYDAAVGRINEWWSSDHTFSGDADNLYIEHKLGGCFCESFSDDGGVIHMLVTFLNRGRMIRLTGGLGPLGLMGVSGNMTWEFNDTDAGTGWVVTYAVGGYSAAGLDKIAGPVEQTLAEQMQRLKALMEDGSASP
jgi:uncharacterized protein YndB with AHSA1/START domain